MPHAVLVDPSNFYSGIVVDAYARLKSTSFDADRYRDFVAAHGEPALEIGCGDGQPLLDLCAEGLEVEGVDSSADMLERCCENALRRGIQVRLHHQRVEDLHLGRRYASIDFAGPTFTLLPDDRTARRALEAIRRHLVDDGMALIPLWVPSPTPEEELGVCRSADERPRRRGPLHAAKREDRSCLAHSGDIEQVRAGSPPRTARSPSGSGSFTGRRRRRSGEPVARADWTSSCPSTMRPAPR